ncbi:DUF3618 domain-containing protein [Saccharothrix algeriensis]|uniref:DUF3618 domain-containing protein n=1 Tax=Saccharothrix algeriensis TaxID=173560 RepID=A0A8T8I2Y8_9PSEU|nr:DUF3618 domain-containing protein [Saccharothrix algeriensis]MBM7810163.1 hypothetical protein [Saccharothrix algeriensis]QTR04354.1 DUF3618 domain-containing protein [Saccharothrix algeriensis]
MSKDVPQDPDALRADIEKTRGELGDTVEALVHKVDVPTRVKETAHESVEQVKEGAAAVAGRVNSAAVVAAEKAQETAAKAQETAVKVTSQVSDRASQAVDSLPPPVAEQVRRHPALIAAGVVAAILLVWRVLRGCRS